MKKKKNFLLLFACLSMFLASGCHRENAKTDEEKPDMELNLTSVKTFASMLEESILQEQSNPAIFNDAFDTLALKTAIAKNSIAASALDLDYGKQIFEGNLNYGTRAAAAVDNGGDFRLDSCYQKGNEYHAIFRIYDTLGGVEFDDFIIGLDDKGELKIKDQYIFNLDCRLTKKMESEIVYNAMRNMNTPDSSATLMEQIVNLCNNQKYSELLNTLRNHPQLAKQYPAYKMYYLIAIKNCANDYLTELQWLKNIGIDERFLLVHEISYQTSNRHYEEGFQAMSKLMEYTGDDPIYWVLFGKSLAEAGQFADALNAFTNAKIGLGKSLWDIWTCELVCYTALNDHKSFETCLASGKKLFNMNEKELKDIAKRFK